MQMTVLLAMGEMVLQGMFDKLIKMGSAMEWSLMWRKQN
jgi:hypothetical protein